MNNSIIIIILIFFMRFSVFAQPTVMTKLNKPASLPCFFNCTGSVKWIMVNNKDRTVAWCDQTSCHSEDGFDMSHDQYLKGNLTLIISAATYSKRTMYICECEGKDVCDVHLSIEATEHTIQLDPGDSLTMDVPIPEEVQVTFHRPGDTSQSSITLCTVKGRHVQCEAEYQKRVTSKFSLTLENIKDSDAGVYTIWDPEKKEEISKYIITGNRKDDKNITRKGKQDDCGLKQLFTYGSSGFVLGIPFGILLVYIVGRILMCCNNLKKKKNGSETVQYESKLNETEKIRIVKTV